MKALGTWETSQ